MKFPSRIHLHRILTSSLAMAVLACPALAQSPSEEFERKMAPPDAREPLFLGMPGSASGSPAHQGHTRVIDVGRRAPRAGYDGREDDSVRMEQLRRQKSDEAWEKRSFSPTLRPKQIVCEGQPPICSER